MTTIASAPASATMRQVPQGTGPESHPTASAASIPFRSADEGGLPAGASGASWFILVLLLLVAAVLLLKRRLHQSWQRPTGLLEVMERRALTAGTQLVVTRYAGRRLLLSVGPAGTQLLRDDADVETSK
jgi:hypothetical protein